MDLLVFRRNRECDAREWVGGLRCVEATSSLRLVVAAMVMCLPVFHRRQGWERAGRRGEPGQQGSQRTGNTTVTASETRPRGVAPNLIERNSPA